MRRKHFLIVISILFIMMTPLHGLADEQNKVSDQAEEAIKDMMDDMTLEEKIGQLFIVHVYGETPTDPNYEDTNLNNNRGGKNFKEVIENYHVGGIIYFNWTDNIGTPVDTEQVNELSNGLQEIAEDQRSEIPLFISTDQEGGIVQRVEEPGTVFPGNMALGAVGSKSLAHQSGEIIGNELSSLGINMNFAPTVDVNMNPDNPVIGIRSFGEDPDLVSDLGIAQINGYKEENVITSAKHFPGHGDTDVDSHYGLPEIDHDLETLHEVDLKPFKEAINSGIESIMTAHIVVPALDDSGLPATLSKPILTDLLREEMGFDGLIITDSLGMSGANVYPEDQVAVEAFKAGADILLNPPKVDVAFEGMLEAVESGDVSMERLDESVFRVLKSKMKQGLFEDPYTNKERIEGIGSDDHLQVAQDIANRGVTLVKNEADTLPVQSSEKVLVTGPGDANPVTISEQLNEKGVTADSFETGMSPTEDEISEAVEKASDVDKVIVTTYTANTDEQQQQLVDRLVETDKPVAVAAMRNPYDLMEFSEVDAYLNAYSYLEPSVNAIANALVGDINPRGTLPVTIPDLYETGHGLSFIDTPINAEGMKELVTYLENEGEIVDEETSHALSMHLTAVEHYEEKELTDKVLKHMNNFHLLLDHHRENEHISQKAHNYLTVDTDQLIELWSAK